MLQTELAAALAAKGADYEPRTHHKTADGAVLNGGAHEDAPSWQSSWEKGGAGEGWGWLLSACAVGTPPPSLLPLPSGGPTGPPSATTPVGPFPPPPPAPLSLCLSLF